MDDIKYLKTLAAVRERSHQVTDYARKNQLLHFNIDMTLWDDAVDTVVNTINLTYGKNLGSIPPHGRWQQFNTEKNDRMKYLLNLWDESNVCKTEQTRRLFDLFFVSVLLDAGTGNKWKYKSIENECLSRSEGLAVASYEMFCEGLFSSNDDNKFQVDGFSLQKITEKIISKSLQVSDDNDSNPLQGVKGRSLLLKNLGDSLISNPKFFTEAARPGFLLDYLLDDAKNSESKNLSVNTLWDVLMETLTPIWPDERTKINGISLGDAWPCDILKKNLDDTVYLSKDKYNTKCIVPFHKLTQWLSYSLLVPPRRLLDLKWDGESLLTALPEYRNGGLLVDSGVMRLKIESALNGIEHAKKYLIAHSEKIDDVMENDGLIAPMFYPDDDEIIEWRACTIGFLDEMLPLVNKKLRQPITLAQMLEAGSWKSGRLLAKSARPGSGCPPICIESDGTIF